MELEGNKGPLSRESQAARECRSRLPLFGCFEPSLGLFWGKMAVFSPKLRRFGRAPPDLAPPAWAATGEFLAQNLDMARPPPRLEDGYMGK